MKKRLENTATKNRKSGFGINAEPLMLLILITIAWQMAVSISGIPPYILPGPLMVIKAMIEERSLLMTHAITTLGEAAAGFGIAILAGLAFGLLMGYSAFFRKVLYPLFVVTQTIPLVILAPLFAIWFGFGLLPKVLIVVLVCFFPVSVTFAQDLIKVDENMESLLAVMGAGRWKTFMVVRIPQALPGLFSGLKIAATYSIMGAVISEWIGAQKGLGIFMTRAMTSFRTAVLFADVLVIIVLSLALYKLVEVAEKKIINRFNHV